MLHHEESRALNEMFVITGCYDYFCTWTASSIRLWVSNSSRSQSNDDLTTLRSQNSFNKGLSELSGQFIFFLVAYTSLFSIYISDLFTVHSCLYLLPDLGFLAPSDNYLAHSNSIPRAWGSSNSYSAGHYSSQMEGKAKENRDLRCRKKIRHIHK